MAKAKKRKGWPHEEMTVCLNCGLILTKGGKRKHGGHFDSDLPHKKPQPFPGIVWGRCAMCYQAATDSRAGIKTSAFMKGR